tara:strand:- start:2080 stop:2850 length:771 start_codon:yes stop_codon:yes gene_type:complete
MAKKTLKKIHDLKKNKEGITALTSYDASFANLADQCGVDILLIGDSLGEVIKGNKNTHSVTMDEMIYHTKNVATGSKNAYLIADLPKHSFDNNKKALLNSKKLIGRSMADMVKIETSIKEINIIKFLVNNKIPVCGHIGIKPQSIRSKKYYKKVGTNIKEYNNLIKEALLVQEAGAGLIIVECIAAEVTQKITSLLSIPVIGIGSGNRCDGQIRVIYDIFGLSFNGTPGFLKKTQRKINILENIISKYINNTKKHK